MDMIAFSLNKDLDPQKLIQSIVKLIEDNVSSQEDADSSVLKISISRVANVVEPNEQKYISA